jgi:hypothetical protein
MPLVASPPSSRSRSSPRDELDAVGDFVFLLRWQLLVDSRLFQFLLKGLATKTCFGNRLVVLVKFFLSSR